MWLYLHILWGLFVLHTVKSESQNENYLQFAPVDGANTNENIYLTDSAPEVHVDSTSKTTQKIYFLSPSELTRHTVQFSCVVRQRQIPLKQIQLCCGTTRHDFSCHRLTANDNAGKISCQKMELEYVYDKLTGANFTLAFNPVKDHTFAYNGQIYCDVLSSDSSIQSQIIDLRDAYFYYLQLEIQPGNEIKRLLSANISPLDFPLQLSCGDFNEKMQSWPSWMASVWQEHLSPFLWGYCTINSPLTPSGCAKYRKSIGVGDSVITMDGTLFLTSDTLLSKHPNSAFVCLHKHIGQPIMVTAGDFEPSGTPKITKGLSMNSSAESVYPDAFQALSPTSQSYQFVNGTDLRDVYLRAFYRVKQDATDIVTTWSKDGKTLLDTKATKYAFPLPNHVDKTIAGTYKLQVEHNSRVQLEFTFKVTVVGPPKFVDFNCLDELFYVLEGSEWIINCVLRPMDESPDFLVGVNGFEATTPSQLKDILQSSLQLKSKQISKLVIDFWPESTGDSKSLAIKVKNLEVGQDFRLSVKAINDNGQSQVTGFYRIVPKPALHISPSQLTCSSDCGREPFEVQCVPSPTVKAIWSDLQIVSLQSWIIGHSLTIDLILEDPQLAQFFQFDANESHTLRVSPYSPFLESTTTSSISQSSSSSSSSMEVNQSTTAPPPATLEEVLNEKLPNPYADLHIECRFELLVNHSKANFVLARRGDGSGSLATPDAPMAIRRSRRQAVEDLQTIYDSYNDPNTDLRDQLTASRSFWVADAVAVASLAWIAAVVVAIVFLLVIVLVGVFLCTRNRGETYKLSKKEYKLGNDPLRELQEKETFRAYERPEEPPSLASVIDEPDLDVGSDEDGELDAYHMDMARLLRHSSVPRTSSRTFNEEASYIGQYSSPSRGPDLGVALTDATQSYLPRQV